MTPARVNRSDIVSEPRDVLGCTSNGTSGIVQDVFLPRFPINLEMFTTPSPTLPVTPVIMTSTLSPGSGQYPRHAREDTLP
jgi:hypothetical protein